MDFFSCFLFTPVESGLSKNIHYYTTQKLGQHLLCYHNISSDQMVMSYINKLIHQKSALYFVL